MNEYEIVQEHEYQDIYRLCYGILLIVNKYREIERVTDTGAIIPIWNYYDTDYNKKLLKKLKGLKNLYCTTESLYTKYGNILIKKGTIIFENRAIEPINNKADYFYELKTTGSCFGGNLTKFVELHNKVKQILERY